MAKQKKQGKTPNTTSVQTNTFIKGLNKDSDPSFVKEGMWTHARNASNNTATGDLGTISNEESNVLCAKSMEALSGDGKDIIGAIHLYSDKWIIYSVQTSELENSIASEIGLFEEDVCRYRVIVNDSCLNFSKLYLITGASRLIDDCSWEVYWADNFNPDRHLNIGDPKLWIDEPFTYMNGQPGSATVNFYTNGTTQTLWPGVVWKENTEEALTPDPCETYPDSNKLDCDKLRLARLLKTPCLDVKKGLAPGVLPNGQYAVTLAYTIDKVRVTNFFTVGYPQPIFFDPDQKGSLEVSVDADHEAFDEFELVLVRFTMQNLDIRRVGYYSTKTTNVLIDLFTNQNPNIAQDTILAKDYVFEKSEQITSVNNYLLRLGPTSKFDFNYQPLANLIEAEWVSVEYPERYYHDGGKNAGYLRDEIYAYFIRWIYDTGDKTPSYHIPGRPPGNYTTPRVPTPPNGEVGGISTTDIAQLNDQNIEGGTSLYDDDQVFEVFNTATQTSAATEILEDNGKVLASGKMGYWQSSEFYPDNQPEIWNSSSQCWTGVDPDDNAYDLCGKPIRHHKFPDNGLSPQTYHFDKENGEYHIRLMGVRFKNIIMPKDNDGNNIPNIVGYEILRGSRNGNQSILAKGIINNFRNYSIKGTPNSDTEFPSLVGLYANYPFNCLVPTNNGTSAVAALGNGTANYLFNDPFIIRRATGGDPQNENRRLKQNVPTDIQSFHSPDTSYNNPAITATELKVYGYLKGTATQQFIEPEKHPRFKLLGNEVVLFAIVGGFIKLILETIGDVKINYPEKNYTLPKHATREANRDEWNNLGFYLPPVPAPQTIIQTSAYKGFTGGGDQSSITNGEDFRADGSTDTSNDLDDANTDWYTNNNNYFQSMAFLQQLGLPIAGTFVDPEENYKEISNKYQALDGDSKGAGNFTMPGIIATQTPDSFLPESLQTVLSGVTVLGESFMYFMEGFNDTVDTLYSLIRFRQYALQQIGHGEYSSFHPHMNGNRNTFEMPISNRFRIPNGFYVRDQLYQVSNYQVDPNNVGSDYSYSLPFDDYDGLVQYRINNLLRPDLAVIRSTTDLEVPAGPAFLTTYAYQAVNVGQYGQSLDQSSMTLGLLNQETGFGWADTNADNVFKDNNKDIQFRNPIASHYVGLKFSVRNLYKQLDNIVQVMVTNCEQKIDFRTDIPDPNSIQISPLPNVCGSIIFAHTKIKTTPVFFGGDTYVTRHTEKTIMPLFYDWLYDEMDGVRFNYFRKQMVPEPRFMVNSDKWDISDFSLSNITDWISNSFDDGEGLLPRSYFDLDCVGYLESQNIVLTYPGLLGVKNAYFYTSICGIKDFFVESEVITDFRLPGRAADEYSYNKWMFTDLNQLFSQNPAVLTKGNYFRYDYSLSVIRFLFSQYYNNGSLQGSNYDPTIAELCYTSFPNRIQYSNQIQEHEAYDSWLMFLAFNKVDFKSELNSVKTFGKTGLMVTFNNNSPLIFQGVDQRETYLGVKATIGDGGLFSTTPQNVVVSDQEYQYGSCQDSYSVISTPAGIYFISQEQGKIFSYTGKLEEISQNGMKWWFDKFLPFKLLEDFINYPYTNNPVAGIGCSATYDNANSILYFSKRDYMLKEEYKGLLDFDPDTNTFKLKDQFRYTIKLGDPRFFKDASWTVSYDPKNKLWISFHDWIPGLYLPSKGHFLTTKNDGVWKHNNACNDYCNFYGEQYPFEIEIPVPTGQTVTTMRSIEYVLECYRKDSALCTDQFHVLDYNFNKAVISNSEQVSGILNLNIFPKNNVALSQLYPKLGNDLASFDVLFSKEENKYRFNQFWDVTKDRGEFPQGSNYPPTGPLVPGTTELIGNYAQNNIWITEPNGYVKNLNEFNLNYNKPLLERKKFRHYLNFVKLIKEDSRDTNMILKIVNTKSQLSQR